MFRAPGLGFRVSVRFRDLLTALPTLACDPEGGFWGINPNLHESRSHTESRQR